MCAICFGRASFHQHSGATASAAVAHRLTESQLATGVAFLARHPTIDIHAHPARFFMSGSGGSPSFTSGYPPLSLSQSIQDMLAGGVSAVIFATVADLPLLSMESGRLQARREFERGEALSTHEQQVSRLRSVIEFPRVRHARERSDVAAAFADSELACLFSVEGGDFIEDRLERVADAHRDGVRSITLVHYKTNQIGDAQTESAVHGGLTALGRGIVRAMNGVGIIVDLAHASFDTAAAAAEVSTQPMLISHSNVARESQSHPRLISLEHARRVTAGGGVIGAVAAGFAQGSFTDFIDTLLGMIDALGIEHVAIGTDMDFTYQPVFTSYRHWPLIPAALLARGLHVREVAAVMGGNFLRVFTAVTGSVPRAGLV